MADICSVSADTQNILNLPSKTRLTKKNNRKTTEKQKTNKQKHCSLDLHVRMSN